MKDMDENVIIQSILIEINNCLPFKNLHYPSRKRCLCIKYNSNVSLDKGYGEPCHRDDEDNQVYYSSENGSL